MKNGYVAWIFAVACWGVFACVPVWGGIPEAFDYTLDTLRQSVARLSQENQALNSRNVAMRTKIKELEVQARGLEEESSRLEERQAAQLRQEQRRPATLDALKEELTRMDVKWQQAVAAGLEQESQLKGMQEDLLARQQQLEALTEDIAALRKPDAVEDSLRPEMVALQAEHEKARQDLYAAANELQAAKGKWQELNEAVTTGPSRLDKLKAQQEELQRTSAALEADLATIKSRKAEATALLEAFRPEDYSDDRLALLEEEVKAALEHNRSVEVSLFAMQKAQDEKLKYAQEEVDAKCKAFQARMDDVARRNQALRQEFQELRQQMVAMDKKKAKLEEGVYSAH